MFHAYSGIMLVCILLSTLKGKKKRPFIFIKVQKFPKIFCTECTKVEGTLQYDLQQLHHLTSMIEIASKSDFLHSAMSNTTRTVHLSNNFLRLTICDSMICIYLKCIRLLPSIKYFTGWHLIQVFRISPTAFYLYSIIKHSALLGSHQQH